MIIKEWAKAVRMFSVQAAALIIAFVSAPPEMQTLIVDLIGIPADKVPGILALFVIIGRLVRQPKVSE